MRRLVDARGSFCPGPLTELIKTYRKAEPGDEIELLATDPAAKSDVKAWAQKSGNEVVSIEERGDHVAIIVRVVKK
ncbi:MAG: sulfurtransferase TusA family protein [Candidatus Caldarchaeales archaeon]|nr:sulfurtransferase TusA family protein [Candidatus Caldarchaeales archaeon]